MFCMSNGMAVTDKYMEKILIGISLRPLTTRKISELYGIPAAVCSKKIKMLESYGLVVCVKKLPSHDDGPIKVYRASEEKVKIEQENGRYVVKIKVPLDIALELNDQ